MMSDVRMDLLFLCQTIVKMFEHWLYVSFSYFFAFLSICCCSGFLDVKSGSHLYTNTHVLNAFSLALSRSLTHTQTNTVTGQNLFAKLNWSWAKQNAYKHKKMRQVLKKYGFELWLFEVYHCLPMYWLTRLLTLTLLFCCVPLLSSIVGRLSVARYIGSIAIANVSMYVQIIKYLS